jgi:Domain of unknown function (DUF6458)
MGFGAGIFLLTVGAMLAFALRVDLWWIDVDAAGLVLMLAGVVVLVVTAFSRHQRSRALYREPPMTRIPPAEPPSGAYGRLTYERTYDPPVAGPSRLELPPPIELPEEMPPENPPQD